MSATTGIEWTDATWNPVVGCRKVSEGCRNCYAKETHDRRHKAHQAGKRVPEQYAHPFERVQLMPQRLEIPLRRRKPTRYFVNSVSDLFHYDVPREFIADVFAVMARAPQHTFQILTKRPARMLEMLANASFLETLAAALRPHLGEQALIDYPLPNVWLGVSVEHQAAADERIELLLRTPAAVRFLSCEPLLGPVDLSRALWRPMDLSEIPGYALNDGCSEGVAPRRLLDWVIVGGESGPRARPMDLAWAVDLVRQCAAADVAAFVKQIGAVPMEREATWRARERTPLLSARNHARVPEGYVPRHPGDRKGGDVEFWPLELRVRQMPGGAGA